MVVILQACKVQRDLPRVRRLAVARRFQNPTQVPYAGLAQDRLLLERLRRVVWNLGRDRARRISQGDLERAMNVCLASLTLLSLECGRRMRHADVRMVVPGELRRPSP